MKKKFMVIIGVCMAALFLILMAVQTERRKQIVAKER